MMDFVLYAPGGKSALATFAQNHPPANPLMDAEGNTREGVSYCWWAGSGNFMTAKGTYDQDGNEITPPTFAPGAVALMRIHTSFWESTKLADQTYDENGNPQLEQWQRNSVVKYIKDNGTPGTMAGGTIPYYELDGVRILRATDVDAFCDANGIPKHIWVGGNSY